MNAMNKLSCYQDKRISFDTAQNNVTLNKFERLSTLKSLCLKSTWSVLILILIFTSFGCGKEQQTHGNKSNELIIEKIDRVAAAEFKEFVENYKNDIVRILEQNNILPTNLPNPYKHINWHLYKSTNMYIENGMGTAKIILSGWEKIHKNNFHKPVILWFERKSGKWYLVVKNRQLTSSVSSGKKALNLSPEIHKSFTRLFPHIEYEDWYKWKDPVRKKLALIRLKTALPQNK